MTSKSEVGISPVLLQAISQTLSSKSVQKQQQVHLTPDVGSATVVQEDAVSVPIATEQVIVSQNVDSTSNLPQSLAVRTEGDETIVQQLSSGETVLLVPSGESSSPTFLKIEKSDDAVRAAESGALASDRNVMTKRTLQVEDKSQVPVQIQLPQHIQQQLPTGDFQMGSVLSAIAMHLSKARRVSLGDRVIQLQEVQQSGSGDGSPIIVSVPASQQNVPSSPSLDISVSNVETVMSEQVVQTVSNSSELPVAKTPRLESTDASSPSWQQQSDSICFRADSFPPGTVLQTIETENGVFHVAQVATADSARPAGGATEVYGPCPICGDRISGYHYGIYSCESCKGFFKRTVQNKKTFMCHRKGECEVNITNRKKCPSCRFKRCIDAGMKLEAIREDRTRGGRSSYDGCSPAPRLSIPSQSKLSGSKPPVKRKVAAPPGPDLPSSNERVVVLNMSKGDEDGSEDSQVLPQTAQILEDLIAMESLMTEEEGEKKCCEGLLREGDPKMFESLLHVSDHCLHKIVRWARNLPDFSSVSTEDQMLLLQNCWAELLFLTVCWNSTRADNELTLWHGRSINVELGKAVGLEEVTQRLIDFAELLKRLEVDTYEFVAIKVLILMSPDVKGLNDVGVLKDYQDKIAESLLVYSTTHYPQHLNKHAELLARLPELTRTCNMAKLRLSERQAAGEVPPGSLLSELLTMDDLAQQQQTSTAE